MFFSFICLVYFIEDVTYNCRKRCDINSRYEFIAKLRRDWLVKLSRYVKKELFSKPIHISTVTFRAKSAYFLFHNAADAFGTVTSGTQRRTR